LRLATAALIVFGVAGLAGCASEESTGPALYTVRPNDTLYSIAWRHNLDYRELARWNHIGPDYRIAVGQRLLLTPPSAMAGAAVGSAASGGSAASDGRARGGRQLPRDAHPSTGNKLPAAEGVAIPHLAWVWPTERSAAPRPVQSGGILFSGRLGQDVCAAAAGRVVYTGSGIRGYGQLIIVKHNDMLLSAYAYNRDVLVGEGQEVQAGQPIAHMGEGAHQNPALYFEIRVNGRPIDPIPFLLGKK
jgi:lipoprotein NlpD